MASRYEDSILRSLRRMSRSLDRHSRRLSDMSRLTAPQIVCLRQVAREGEISPGALAKRVSLSQGTVTGILDRLEARHLITRSRSPNDKRKVIVRLTDEGVSIAEASPSPLQESFSTRLRALHEGEQAVIDWVLQRVASMMEDKPAEQGVKDDLRIVGPSE